MFHVPKYLYESRKPGKNARGGGDIIFRYSRYMN
jgi:hypothetical protein